MKLWQSKVLISKDVQILLLLFFHVLLFQSWKKNNLSASPGYCSLCLKYTVFISRNQKICKCDADCTDFGDCCFDWQRLYHNETDSLNFRKRRFQCKKWFDNVSMK